MDPVTGGALITGLKTLFDMCKDKQDPKMAAVLLEIQGFAFQLVNENQGLREAVGSLTAKLGEREKIELKKDGAVWRKEDVASEDFGGFCPNCHGTNGRLVKLNADSGCIPPQRVCTICKMSLSGPWD